MPSIRALLELALMAFSKGNTVGGCFCLYPDSLLLGIGREWLDKSYIITRGSV